MGHQDYGFGAVGGGIFYGGKGTDDALIIGYLFVGVEGDVEVDLDEGE